MWGGGGGWGRGVLFLGFVFWGGGKGGRKNGIPN